MARARLGLSRGQRIRKRADFVRIQSGGLRVTTRHFLILLAAGALPATGEPGSARSPREGAPRLGIVASRKVGGAVIRNRAKRLVREAFRTAPALFPPGVDVVVIVRSGAHALDLAAVAAELDGVRSLLRRRAAEAIAAGIAAPPAGPLAVRSPPRAPGQNPPRAPSQSPPRAPSQRPPRAPGQRPPRAPRSNGG
jgi:ribonuclease P protein component